MISIDFLSRTPGDKVPDCSKSRWDRGNACGRAGGPRRLPGEEGKPGGEEGELLELDSKGWGSSLSHSSPSPENPGLLTASSKPPCSHLGRGGDSGACCTEVLPDLCEMLRFPCLTRGSAWIFSTLDLLTSDKGRE